MRQAFSVTSLDTRKRLDCRRLDAMHPVAAASVPVSYVLQSVGCHSKRERREQSLVTSEKNWDDFVVHAEEVARSRAFLELRDRILELARPELGEVAVDIGAGTGLLSLAIADRVARIWAIDISPAMCSYLDTKAASAGFANVMTAAASAVSLPLIDESADLVVSNYCFHHLDNAAKRRALAEVHRVLRPGGRFVCGDMMFRVSIARRRDRALVAGKVIALLRKGPAGALRLARNAVRILTRRFERPARADWWRDTLVSEGFEAVHVELFQHEGGIAIGRRPVASDH